MKRLTDEQKKLVADNLGLVYTLSRRVSVRQFNRSTEDDILAGGMLGMCYAATSFDSSRGVKFTTYAGRAIVQRAKKARDAVKYETEVIPQDHPAKYDPTTDFREEAEDARAKVAKMLDHFPKYRQVIQRHYLDGVPLKDVAEEMGLDRCTFLNLRKQILRAMQSFAEREWGEG